METLLAPLAEITAYRNAEEAIQKQKFPLQISGCIESQKCQWIYGLTGESPKWKVIIAANELRAREIAEDYRMFDREVMYYPAKDVIFFSADVHGTSVQNTWIFVELTSNLFNHLPRCFCDSFNENAREKEW